MLKKILAFTCLTLSIGANAAIVSLDSSFGTDTITRDTATGLDWLDVTVTRGLSFDQVTAKLCTPNGSQVLQERAGALFGNEGSATIEWAE